MKYADWSEQYKELLMKPYRAVLLGKRHRATLYGYPVRWGLGLRAAIQMEEFEAKEWHLVPLENYLPASILAKKVRLAAILADWQSGKLDSLPTEQELEKMVRGEGKAKSKRPKRGN